LEAAFAKVEAQLGSHQTKQQRRLQHQPTPTSDSSPHGLFRQLLDELNRVAKKAPAHPKESPHHPISEQQPFNNNGELNAVVKRLQTTLRYIEFWPTRPMESAEAEVYPIYLF
jgi:hypothetical protein